MKKILALSASMVFATVAFATEAAKPAQGGAPAVTASAPITTSKDVVKTAAAKKVSVKKAKEECLKEDGTLKGKALKECIKNKRA